MILKQVSSAASGVETRGILVCTVSRAPEGLEHLRILADAFIECDPVVDLARNDYEPGECGVLSARFDHRRKEEEGYKRGGQAVDLQARTLCQRGQNFLNS